MSAGSRSNKASVRLVPCPSLSASDGGGGRRRFSFPVDGEGGGGVDLGAVGRYLGLDPSTVRLNGHYLSRGPDLVSSVSWGSLASFFAARGFPAGDSDQNPIVVHGRPFPAPGIYCPSDGEDGCGLAFKRKVWLEDERPSKKNRVAKYNSDTIDVRDMRPSDSNSKRKLKMKDDNSFKKQKISNCNPGLGNEASITPTSIPKNKFPDDCTNDRSSVKLVMCPLSISSGQKPVSFPVACEGRGGVDLGSIGRLLGLDPSTVRLNGHFLSRGTDLISSVTWNSLVSFFSSRGFPTGDSDYNSIVVQGKPLLTTGSHSPNRVDGKHQSFKRKVVVEDETPLKKIRAAECSSSKIETGNGQLSDDVILCTRRRLSLENNNPFKKPKTSESHESPVVPGNGFPCSCINGYGKRIREDEMVPAISCKRVG